MYPGDAAILIDGERIPRPNHGLAHALKQASYLEEVINFYAEFAIDPEFRVFCKAITLEQLLDLQTVALFGSTGRESDISFSAFSADPNLYRQYREASARHHAQLSKEEGYSVVKNRFYTEQVLHMGNPDFISEVAK